MSKFYKHDIHEENGSYIIRLYTHETMEEFSAELGEAGTDSLQQDALAYAKQKFPYLSVKSVKVMAGTAMVASMAIGAGAMPTQAAGKAPVKVSAPKSETHGKAHAAKGKHTVAVATGSYDLHMGGRTGRYQAADAALNGTETYTYNGATYRVDVHATLARNPHSHSPIVVQGKASGTYTIMTLDGTLVATQPFSNLSFVLNTKTKVAQLPLTYEAVIQAYLDAAPAAGTAPAAPAVTPPAVTPPAPAVDPTADTGL
ncbi:hypothetical protein [Ectobacillus ponti]|uniref:Uncharacterized protein n=1 Tax=Ectobacillus ponti TaxID=2961894 RepID=A0AA42BSZ0_9BACI|nr:hypothetical protein [Ectobacillus ponti]MCP8971049.1 hypothetical protein [Ectobacillus ponti]